MKSNVERLIDLVESMAEEECAAVVKLFDTAKMEELFLAALHHENYREQILAILYPEK